MDFANPSFIGKRQQHLYSITETALNFTATKENEKAGLMIFQDERHFYFLGKSIAGGKPVLQLFQSNPKEKTMNLLTEVPVSSTQNQVKLRISSAGDKYNFYYATAKENWQVIKDNVDGKFLSTKTAGGFIGCIYGMYATSSGESSNNSASFKYLKYKGNDPMFK